MALKFAVSTRNAILNAIETEIGTSAVLKIRTGAGPAGIADADSGTVLATLTLPSDWMAAADAGAKALAGSWTDASADADGTAAHFRIYASDGTTQKIQGTVGTSGEDLNFDSVSITAGQSVTITGFTLTAPNA